MVSGGGLAAAAASAGFNGSFGLFQKLPSISHAQACTYPYHRVIMHIDGSIDVPIQQSALKSWSAGHDSCVKSIYTCKHSRCIHKLNLLTQSDSAYLQVSPVIFNFWFAAGIVISSLVLLVKYPLVSLATFHPRPCVLHHRILHLTPSISSDFHSIDCCMQHRSAICNPCTAFKPLLPALLDRLSPN